VIFVYQISIHLYHLAIKIAALFKPKAKAWLEGRKTVFEDLDKIEFGDNTYWFHCASLGELEQGKPVIEALKKENPSIEILITFFSPSGFEHGLRYELSDHVFYLPIDTPKNAEKFIQAVQPKRAFFIKYEFWYNYLYSLHTHSIPTYLISGVFRKNQIFFKWYGKAYRNMLNFFTHFFVQNEASKVLLENQGFEKITVTGDTRLDRVYENSLAPDNPPLIKKFTENKKTIIVGSSWSKEEELISHFISTTKKDFKFIIAPHDVSESRIMEIEKLLEKDFIRYSNANYEIIASFKTLIIYNIGILANSYQYTDIAFVGGGYSGALHNVLEPASFGNVIFFGPKHDKFHEAEELINIKGAYNISYVDDLIALTNHLLFNDNLTIAQKYNLEYVKNGRGAAKKILQVLNKKA
jgi:3-deoxy-D-manno-octulosonic-acid transferase